MQGVSSLGRRSVRMNRLGRLATLAGTAAAVAAGLPVPAQAASPPTPPGCGTPGSRTVVDESPRPIPDNGSVSDGIDISGAGGYLADVDVQTTIAHTFAADLDVLLVSPAGTQVTLTADNAEGHNNVFRGTLWDDDAGDSNPPGPVTDNEFQNNAVESPLVPEEAMGAFTGENPNGTWTLRVQDDNSGDTGALERWSVAVTTCSATPPSASATAAQGTPVPLGDNAVGTSTLALAGLGTHLLDLDLTTQVAHTFGADLDISLTSPAGTAVTVTTDNGGDADNVFRGTVWDDDAGDSNPPGPVTLNTFQDGVVESPLVPEEAMGAFAGEDPNGTWTLRVEDDNSGDTGVLESWSLSARTEPVAPPPDLTRPVLSGLALRPRAFRAARRGSAIARRIGSRVGYRLSEAATVRFRVDRTARGRRVRGRCVPATRRNAGRRRCTRFVRLRREFSHRGRAGANRFRFTGRLGGRRLRPRAYRLVAVATDAAGNRSARRFARFRITRR
jgi:subtilisin-like proprotein convertase family protein